MGGEMTFDVSTHLRQATGRSKSDVANKLVSMLLHDISRRAVTAAKSSIADPQYTSQVKAVFGNHCLYCGRLLEKDRVAVEHLDGMNRFRLGLHIPGNVAVACKECNGEKRRDDQRPRLILADSGWESFLSHDGARCEANCKTCQYWAKIWPDAATRIERLNKASLRIKSFRQPYAGLLNWSASTRKQIQAAVETVYRECQEFASSRIATLSEGIEIKYDELANGGERLSKIENST